MSLVQTRYENIPAVLKYAIFGSGPLTVLGGVEVGRNYFIFCIIDTVWVIYVESFKFQWTMHWTNVNQYLILHLLVNSVCICLFLDHCWKMQLNIFGVMLSELRCCCCTFANILISVAETHQHYLIIYLNVHNTKMKIISLRLQYNCFICKRMTIIFIHQSRSNKWKMTNATTIAGALIFNKQIQSVKIMFYG